MRINFLLVDALNLIRRVYAAQPGDDGSERTESALSSSVHSLQRALRECMPTHAVCVFDSHETSWRHLLHAGYKANHAPMPEALKLSLAKFEKAFCKIGISSLTYPALEADDIIATLARKVALRRGNAIILSTDKAFFQLISDRIKVRDHFQKLDLGHAYVMERFHVQPGQFADFLALTGNRTNNIAGVPAIGPKTAARLLTEFGSLDHVLSAANTIKGRFGRILCKHVKEARMSQSLMRLRDDIELGLNLKSFRYSH